MPEVNARLLSLCASFVHVSCAICVISACLLIHCSLVSPCDIVDLGQHCASNGLWPGGNNVSPE